MDGENGEMGNVMPFHVFFSIAGEYFCQKEAALSLHPEIPYFLNILPRHVLARLGSIAYLRSFNVAACCLIDRASLGFGRNF